MNYIIAAIEGNRDFAPKYEGKFGKSFEYGSFTLIIWKGGNYERSEYEEAYKEISDYITSVNNATRGYRFANGVVRAEMLTPNEQNQYNDTRCLYFHSWLVQHMLTSDEIIVSKVNVFGKDLYDRINVWQNMEQVGKMARVISGEMLSSILLPGEYLHNNHFQSENPLFLKDYPIFVLGYNLPYDIQIIDNTYRVK